MAEPTQLYQRCKRRPCKNNHALHKWGSIKANGDGWFHFKDGTALCPEHIPDWVQTYRESMKK